MTTISVVTPTLDRPTEVGDLLRNLASLATRPDEVILVDGVADDRATEWAVAAVIDELPFRCTYVRHGGGTAIQRNAGINLATGDYVAFVDDDVRLEPDFFTHVLKAFLDDGNADVGGIVGHRRNVHVAQEEMMRWRWYRRLRLLSTFEPGRYDFRSGYPINANLQPPFTGTREVDFMTTACAVWRREVLDSGLRFDPWFRDYGVLEDAHFSLRAGRRWRLLQCGDAVAAELHASGGRQNRRRIGRKCVVNYHYVFSSVAGPLDFRQRFAFWRFQAFEMFRMASSLVRRRRRDDWLEIVGRLEGIVAVATRRDGVPKP